MGIIIDNFAGGGGASVALEQAFGRSVDEAINHSPKAVAVHRANHPATHHYCEDIWNVHPRQVADGRPIEAAWFSPDCTHHSNARGGKPRDKKIRGLAWIVVQYAATVKPKLMFLENVEEFAEWGPLDKSGRPIKQLKGRTFNNWVHAIKDHGYSIEWKELVAADYGAPTSRKRLFMVMRNDGRPIVWPSAEFGTIRPYHTAAECIDWSLPCPSIFTRKRPLVENTMKRIARGIQKFVIDTSDPFVIPTERGLSMSFLTRQFGRGAGRAVNRPIPTITPGGMGKTGLVTSYIIKFRGTGKNMNIGHDMREPLHTISASGFHHGEVRAFLIKYYGNSSAQAIKTPMHSITSKDRFGLVTVAGEKYEIMDIGMRMLTPEELKLAQGFPKAYILNPLFNGRPLSKTAQVFMIGNSVSPPPAEALVKANGHQ